MKIVIIAESGSIDAAVNPQFGRAASYILYDLETGDWSAHDSTQNLVAEQGSGVQAAQAVIRLGPAAVVTGRCCPKAFQALQAAGLDVYTGAQGTVQEAVTALREGRLEKTMPPMQPAIPVRSERIAVLDYPETNASTKGWRGEERMRNRNVMNSQDQGQMDGRGLAHCFGRGNGRPGQGAVKNGRGAGQGRRGRGCGLGRGLGRGRRGDARGSCKR